MELFVKHEVKKIGATPQGKVEVFDSDGKLLFRNEESFRYKSEIHAAYKLVHRFVSFAKRCRATTINIESNHSYFVSEMQGEEFFKDNTLLRQTQKMLQQFENVNVRLIKN
jgi:hypothetical protein